MITSIYQLKLCKMYANMQRLIVFGGSAIYFVMGLFVGIARTVGPKRTNLQ